MASGAGGLFGGYCHEHVVSEESLWANKWTLATRMTHGSHEFLDNTNGGYYISGVVEEVAQSSIHEESARIPKPFCKQESLSTTQTLSTSPQSTLAGLSWDLQSPGSSSSYGGLSSGFSSPPTPVEAATAAPMPCHNDKDTLDLLYTELVRLKLEDELHARQQRLNELRQQQHYQTILWKLRQQQAAASMSDASAEFKLRNCKAHPASPSSASYDGYYSRNSEARSEDLHQKRGFKQVNGAWSVPRAFKSGHGEGVRRTSWGGADITSNVEKHRSLYSQKPQSTGMNGSGMRAVFLGIPGGRETSGTGVFLPRRIGGSGVGGGGSLDSRRKPGCSTVLLPSRIVQALNLNVEDTLPRSSTSSTPRRDVYGTPLSFSSTNTSGRAEDMSSEWIVAPNNVPVACSSLQEVAPDISLPTEWTY